MEIGEGSAWVGVLVGGLFALLLIPLFLTQLFSVARRLVRGIGGLLSGKASLSGLGGMAAILRADLLSMLLLAFFGALSLLIFAVSLVNYVPLIGSWPPVTSVLSMQVNQAQAQGELRRGVRENNSGLIRAALALGADARNADGAESLLPQLRDPALRQLLIEHGASANGLGDQKLPLQQAMESQDFELYQWLLQAGADPNARLRDANQHFVVSLAQIEPPLGDEWLIALIDHGVDLNRRTPSGLSVRDGLTLMNLRADWLQRLRDGGAQHGLPLDRGMPLTPEHAAIAHVRQWLQARGSSGWQEGDGRWELPGASETGIYYFLPVKLIELQGRVDGNEAVVAATGPAGGGAVRTTQVLLRWIQAEAAERVVERGLADTEQSEGYWRIAGFWLDERTSVESIE